MSILTWLRGRFGAAPKGPSCLACDSTELESLAPDAYRCSSCGHEGGEGLPAWIAARKRSEIEAMSAEQRQALARKNLDTARNLLAGAHVGDPGGAADVAAAVVKVTLGVTFGVRMANEGAEDEQRAAAAMFQALLESEQLLEQAAVALEDECRIPAMKQLKTMPMRLDNPSARARLLEVAGIQRIELDRLSSRA